MRFAIFFLALFCLASCSEDEPIALMAKGYLKGLKDATNPTNFINCLLSTESYCYLMAEGLDLILTMEKAKMLEGFSKFIDGLFGFLDIMDPCIKGYPQIVKLVTALKNLDMKKLIDKLIAKIMELALDVLALINSLKNDEYEPAGKYFGAIQYKLFLA